MDDDYDNDINYHHDHVNMTLSWLRIQFRYIINKSKLVVPLYYYKGIIGYENRNNQCGNLIGKSEKSLDTKIISQMLLTREASLYGASRWVTS